MNRKYLQLPISILFVCLAGTAWAQQAGSEHAAGPTPAGRTAIPPRQDTVVVTGEPQPVPLDEVDRSVTLLEPRQSPELFHSLADFLVLEPSLDLQQRAPNGMQGDLSIRGSTFGQTLVLVNGFRVNDAQTGHHNLDLPLPLDSLERIEVLRGAGSMLYGSDALGGTVNFITRPPAVSEIRMGVAGGSFGTNAQSASVTYAAESFSQQVSFARELSTGFMADRDYRNLAFASDSRIKSRLGQSSILLGYSDRPFGADGFYGNYASWERTKAWFAALRQQIGERTGAEFAYRRHTDNFILLRNRPSYYSNNHETDGWQAALRRRQPLSQNVALIYGVEGYRESIASNKLGRHGRNQGAVYADLDVRAWRRFSFSAGLREELYAKHHSELSPGFSAGAWLSSKLKLRGSVNHAFRLPSYTELFYSDPATRGNPDLRPESAWSYEGGLDWHPAEKVTVSTTVFHRRERDGIDYARASAKDLWQASNIQRLNFTGIETAVKLHVFRAQELSFAYTAMHGQQEGLAGLQTKYSGNYPTQNGVIAWQGVFPGRVVGRTRIGATNRRSEDPYLLWDFSVARRFGRFSPYLQFANLTNSSYWEIPGVTMPGRSLLAGIEFVLARKSK